MTMLLANNATSRLRTATDAVSTSIRVMAGEGAKFPSPTGGDYFMVTLEDRRTGQIEICRCTARSGDFLTVTRAQEGTTGQAFAAGATVSNRLTAGSFATTLTYAYTKAEADARFLQLAGGVMTGPLALAGPASSSDEAVTLAQLDGVYQSVPHEAPEDGLPYLRQNASWVEASTALGIPEAPDDGVSYVRKDMAWEPGVLEAPADGTPYARMDSGWTEVNVDIVSGRAMVVDGAQNLALPDWHLMEFSSVTGIAFTTIDGDELVGAVNGVAGIQMEIEVLHNWGYYVVFGLSKNGGQINELGRVQVNSNDYMKVRSEYVVNIEAGATYEFYISSDFEWMSFAWRNGRILAILGNSAATGGQTAATSDTPPANPAQGDLWWDTASGNSFIWYDDGTSAQWVQLNDAGADPFADVPQDGAAYGRVMTQWAAVVEEAPEDGTPYMRQDAAWAPALPEAPEDGTPYARQDAAWVEVVEEAPEDGTPYVRQDKGWLSLPEPGGGAPFFSYVMRTSGAFGVPGEIFVTPTHLYVSNTDADGQNLRWFWSGLKPGDIVVANNNASSGAYHCILSSGPTLISGGYEFELYVRQAHNIAPANGSTVGVTLLFGIGEAPRDGQTYLRKDGDWYPADVKPVNQLINGDFDIWQRGTSFGAATGYTADRWTVAAVGTTLSVGRAPVGSWQGIAGEPQYYASMSTLNANGTNVQLIQKIESARTLAGKTATLSFWAKAASGAASIYVGVNQFFGTGGSPSPATDPDTQQVDLTTSWQKFSLVFDIPTVSEGKVLGTDGNDSLNLHFYLSNSGLTGVPDNQQSIILDLAHVSLVEGNWAWHPDPFQKRNISEENSLCERFFWSLDSGEVFSGTSIFDSSGSVPRECNVFFPTTMRAPPTISNITATGNNDGTPTPFAVNRNGARIRGNTLSDGGSWRLASMYADAEL